jgi:ParB-like chromosome segregation protein Spo0J
MQEEGGAEFGLVADPTREPAAEWVAVSSLKPWADNPRKNDGPAISKVARSIKRFGWGNPILARREDREVVAGHTRLKAIALLTKQWGQASERKRQKWHPEAVGIVQTQQVPVRFGDWDEDEAHLLAVADNRTAEEAEWDETLLKDVLSDFDDLDALDAGFDSKEIDKLLDGEPTREGAGVDEIGLSYQVLVECRDERHQGQTLEKLEALGYKVKPLAT